MSSPPNKKMKQRYTRHSQKQFLAAGQSGFLATCNFHEKDCVRECYNILNEYADELYGRQVAPPASTEADNVDDEDTGDIADDLQREVAAAKQKGKHATLKPRFQCAETGVTNCVFIRTTLPDPVELGTRIIEDIASTRQSKSRYLLRLVPIATVCRANITDIKAAAGLLCDKYFLKEASTFSVVCNKRYNNDVDRQEVCIQLAELVHSKNIKNRVDLKQPEKSIIVEVIKGLCCLSVVNYYFKYKKYNLVELANAKPQDDEKSKEEEKPKQVKETEKSPKNVASEDDNQKTCADVEDCKEGAEQKTNETAEDGKNLSKEQVIPDDNAKGEVPEEEIVDK